MSWLSRAFSRPWSWVTLWYAVPPVGSGTSARIGRRSRPLAFQCWIAALSVTSEPTCPTASLEGAEAQLGEVLAHLLRDVLEEGLDELRLAGEPRPQLRVLGGDPDRAGVQVADPHHDAPAHHEGGGGEAELLGAEQGRDDDVAAGLELPVGLHDDPVAQPVEPRVCWVSASPSSHGAPACLSEVSGEAPVPPSWPEMSTTSACALETPAATVPTPTSATSLTWTRAAGLAFLRSWMSWARSSIE